MSAPTWQEIAEETIGQLIFDYAEDPHAAWLEVAQFALENARSASEEDPS